MSDVRRHAEHLSGVKSDIAGTATPQRSGTSNGMKHVVLNCANIGCTYGENVLKRTKPGQNKFDWKGVEDAYQYYEGAGFTVHAIIGQRLLSQVGGRDKISQKLESALVVIPSRDGLPDIDDYSTILEAYKWKCSYVDNDNYRNWGARMKGRPEVARWYGENKRQLHVSYYFDRFGKFTPLDGAAPGTAEPSRKDPTPNPPATAASHPVQELPALSSSTSGSSQTVAAGKGAPASHGLGRRRAQEARSQGEKRVVEEAPEGSEPPAKRPRGELEVIQLGSEIIAPPTGNLKWKALVPVRVWQRPQVGGYQECLRMLEPGATFIQIAQQPRKGEPRWLALHPRGWVEANAADGTATVQRLGNVVQHRRRHLHRSCFHRVAKSSLHSRSTRAGFCQSRYPWMRKLALEALAVMDPEDLELHSDVVAGRLQDTDDDVCFEAIRTLKRLKPDVLEKHAAVLSRLLADEDWNVRLAALSTLSRLEPLQLSRYSQALKDRCTDDVHQVSELAGKVWQRFMQDLPRLVVTCSAAPSCLQPGTLRISCISMAGNDMADLSMHESANCKELRELLAERLQVPVVQLKLLTAGAAPKELVDDLSVGEPLAAQDDSWMYILKMLRLFVALELSENTALSLESGGTMLRDLGLTQYSPLSIKAALEGLRDDRTLLLPCARYDSIEASLPISVVMSTSFSLLREELENRIHWSTELVGTDGAAFRGSQPEVCQLLEEGAEIDHRDGSRLRTPLMWAASAGNVAICNQLLHHGANPCLRSSGAKAAQLAEANGYNELAEMLARAEKEWMELGTVQSALAPAPKPRFRRPLVAADCGQALALSVLLLSWIIGWSSTSWCTSAVLAGLALLAAFLVIPVRKLVATNLCRRRSKSVVAPMPFKPHAAADVVEGIEGPLPCNSGCRQYLKSAIWEM
ncbi:unnamed protein product [Symbiodinium sp. CCMP2592]|nr:unnamed protein product [Symbiodinium sp. CCMP2592]